MKKILSIALALSLMLAACAPTFYGETASGAQTPANETEWKETYAPEGSYYRAEIDAAVTYPSAQEFPVSVYERAKFSDETAVRLAKAFTNEPLYEYSELNKQSKEDMTGIIDSLTARVQNVTGIELAITKKQISNLETQRRMKEDGMPSYIPVQSDLTLKDAGRRDKSTSIQAYTMDREWELICDNITDRWLVANTLRLSRGSIVYAGSGDQLAGPFADGEDGSFDGVELTLAGARGQADGVVKLLGADLTYAFGMLCEESPYYNLPVTYYWFRYVRHEGNVRFSKALPGQGETDMTANNFPIRSEYLDICVSDRGVLSVEWYSPMEKTETVTENVKIKSFDEIKEDFFTVLDARTQRAKEQTDEAYWKENLEGGTFTYLIKEARFSYAFEFISDSLPYRLRAVPVWEFICEKEVYVNPEGEISERDYDDVAVTLNAVTGKELNSPFK